MAQPPCAQAKERSRPPVPCRPRAWTLALRHFLLLTLTAQRIRDAHTRSGICTPCTACTAVASTGVATGTAWTGVATDGRPPSGTLD
eukprot:7350875-Prymnesium_polylepis.3